MNTETRINGNDSVQMALLKMSEGNPGCLVFLTQFIQLVPTAFLLILQFDGMGLYGSKLYMLWNDCCNKDVNKVAEVMRRRNRGEITDAEIMEHVSGVYGTAFEFKDREEEEE